VYALVEELIFRGYPLSTLARAAGPLRALLLTSAAFAFVHLANPASGAAGILGAFLAGAVLGAVVLRWRSLWAAWGFHFAWNYAQAAIFGLPVSGVASLAHQPLRITRIAGPAWLTGGSYGMEACLPALFVLAGVAWLLIFWTRWPSLQEIHQDTERCIREEQALNISL
jgi:membrane protease YdiL (CAAX protease family)